MRLLLPGDKVRKHGQPDSSVGVVVNVRHLAPTALRRDLVTVEYPDGSRTTRHLAYWVKVAK